MSYIKLTEATITKSNGKPLSAYRLRELVKQHEAGNPQFETPDGSPAIVRRGNGYFIYIHKEARRIRRHAISDGQVNVMRELHKDGNSIADIARQYDIEYDTAYKIVTGLRR